MPNGLILFSEQMSSEKGSAHSIVLPQRLEGLVERVRVVDRHKDFQFLAFFDHSPTFDDVQLVAVRRAVIVEERLVVEADGIDDERIVLVMANVCGSDGRRAPRPSYLCPSRR
jgi:hypothetical protein